jgi:hypothetical protein
MMDYSGSISAYPSATFASTTGTTSGATSLDVSDILFSASLAVLLGTGVAMLA